MTVFQMLNVIWRLRDPSKSRPAPSGPTLFGPTSQWSYSSVVLRVNSSAAQWSYASTVLQPSSPTPQQLYSPVVLSVISPTAQ